MVFDWLDSTTVSPELRGPALKNRLIGDAAIQNRCSTAHAPQQGPGAPLGPRGPPEGPVNRIYGNPDDPIPPMPDLSRQCLGDLTTILKQSAHVHAMALHLIALAIQVGCLVVMRLALVVVKALLEEGLHVLVR